MRYLDHICMWWSWDRGLHYLLLFGFFIVVYGPLVGLIADTGHYFSSVPHDASRITFPLGRRWGLMINSLALAIAVAASGMVLGILAASVLWRWRTGIGAYLRWSLLVLAPIPAYICALAWSSTIDDLNLFLNWLGWPTLSLMGWIGAWWVQLLALLPIATGLALVGLESVEPKLIEAGELMRSDIQVFARIILPLSAPPIIAGTGLLFLLSITDYSVPSLFSVNVYSLEIFAEYSASNQPSRAMLLALPLLLVTIFVVVISQASLRNTAQISAWHIRDWMPPSWPSWFDWLQKFGMTILLIEISVIIFGLAATVGSWDNLISSVYLARSEISFTFWIAIATALICIPFSIAAAIELKRSGVRGYFWWLLVTIPLAIPAPLIGIGLICFWSQSMMPGIYGSSAMPILAMLARFIPLAAILLLFQFRFINPLLIDAARVFQTNQLQTWAKIWLPLMIPGILAAAGIAFALTIGELGATLIVAPPGQATLSMRIYNYLHYGASSNVAGLCLMMAIVMLIMGCMVVVVLSGRTYLSRREVSDVSEK